MRAIMLAVLLAGTASADPKAKGLSLPDIVKESIETAKLVDPNGALGIGGTVSAGLVIKPPETGDQNVLVPGTNQLPWWRTEPRGPVSKELLDGIEGGVGKFIELLVPPSS